MVHLILSSTKGNQGLRYFPYSGYLGLTPIRVEGSTSFLSQYLSNTHLKLLVVRTRLDADQKPLQAKSISISVRCYETRTGRVNVLQSNVLVDYTQVLWSKPDGVEYESIGNLEFPFRISMPTKVAGFSTAVFVDYRCTWRVEAVVTHIPVTGVGSRQIRHFELPFVRYDVPSWSPSLSTTTEPPLDQQTNKPRAPRIRYSISSPKTPVGPLDLVSIPIHLQPVDPGVSIRSASVIVERRIFLHESTPPSASMSSSISPQTSAFLQSSSSSSSLTKPSTSPLLQPSFPESSHSPAQSHQEPPLDPEPASSTLSLSSSNPTLTPGTVYPSSASLSSEAPLIPPPTPNYPNSQQSSSSQASSKIVVNHIAGAQSSGNFARDAKGIWTKTLTLQWPAAKSHSRWAIGETINSEFVSVKYFVRAKIIVTSPSGTETIELAEQELLVVSTNETERQLAIAKYNEMHDAMVVDGYTRSKSKSPRRSRLEREDAMPPSPGVNNIGSSSSRNTAAPSSYTRSKSSSSRRPHTSAGPRDKPVSFAGGAYGRPRVQEGEASGHMQMPSGHGTTSHGGNGASGGGVSSAAAKRRSELVVMRTSRPDTSHSDKKNTQVPRSVGGNSSSSSSSGKLPSTSFWSTVHSNGTASAPRVKGVPSGSSTSTTASSSSVSSSSHGAESEPCSDHMREWEEELAMIEIRSRRSSDLLGFSGKRKRSAGPPRVVVPGEVDE